MEGIGGLTGIFPAQSGRIVDWGGLPERVVRVPVAGGRLQFGDSDFGLRGFEASGLRIFGAWSLELGALGLRVGVLGLEVLLNVFGIGFAGRRLGRHPGLRRRWRPGAAGA